MDRMKCRQWHGCGRNGAGDALATIRMMKPIKGKRERAGDVWERYDRHGTDRRGRANDGMAQCALAFRLGRTHSTTMYDMGAHPCRNLSPTRPPRSLQCGVPSRVQAQQVRDRKS